MILEHETVGKLKASYCLPNTRGYSESDADAFHIRRTSPSSVSQLSFGSGSQASAPVVGGASVRHTIADLTPSYSDLSATELHSIYEVTIL